MKSLFGDEIPDVPAKRSLSFGKRIQNTAKKSNRPPCSFLFAAAGLPAWGRPGI
jgi:hypothetical protein